MGKNQTSYNDEFRERAVKMLQGSGKTKKQIARELGVNVSTLRGWEKSFSEEPNLKPVKAGEMSKEELIAKLKETEKELQRVTEQREILKKATAILGS